VRWENVERWKPFPDEGFRAANWSQILTNLQKPEEKEVFAHGSTVRKHPSPNPSEKPPLQELGAL
jgi:hypothetical protein